MSLQYWNVNGTKQSVTTPRLLDLAVFSVKSGILPNPLWLPLLMYWHLSTRRRSCATPTPLPRHLRESGGKQALDSNLLRILPKWDPIRHSSGLPGPKLAPNITWIGSSQTLNPTEIGSRSASKMRAHPRDTWSWILTAILSNRVNMTLTAFHCPRSVA